MLLALGALVTLAFADGRLDLAAAEIFYRADPREHWPLGAQLPWSVLYRMAPWITASLVLGALAALTVGVVRRRDSLRREAVFVLLSVALGPGLLVNGVFKDHWHRPRPRDVVEFGGELAYSPAPLRGEGGKSFPCGHCSVGFLYAAGWWIWRRRRLRWAGVSLAAGLAAGAALGIGRMAAGGHFLSDIFWSAFMALGVAHLLYHYALPSMTRHASAIIAGVLGIGVLAALFATPHGTRLAEQVPLASLPRVPQIFQVTARNAQVEILVVDSDDPRVLINGELHGFGLPASRLSASAKFDAEPVPTLHYGIEQRGWFTDLDAALSIRLPSASFQRIVVRLGEGNIKIVDATRAHLVKGGQIQLDLQTKAGRVRISDG